MPRVLTALLLAALAACSKPAPQAPAPRLYADPKGLFTFAPPAGWTESRDGASPNENVTFSLKDGADLYELSVYYYAPGNPYYAGPEAFLRRAAKGEGAAEERALPAGRASLWSGRVPELGTPEKTRRHRRYQAYAVLPAGRGFFTLGYAAPEGSQEKRREAYEALLRSFTFPKGL